MTLPLHIWFASDVAISVLASSASHPHFTFNPNGGQARESTLPSDRRADSNGDRTAILERGAVRLTGKCAVSDTLHDADLLARVAMHDTQALSDLYDRFAPILYGVAVKMLRSEAEAEDVLQEVFLKVWEKAGSYDAHLGSPFAWLITLLRNRAHDRLRALGRQYRAFDSLGTDAQSGSMDSLTPTHSLLREEISSLMREALNQLPRDQREAIELAFLGGLTQNEIAEQLQQPLGTIKARIRRGMIALRDHLPPEWWPNGGIMDWNQSPGSSSKGHSNEEAP